MSIFSEISEVTTDLYLSSAFAIKDEALREHDITLIINATKELPLWPTIDVIRIPLVDSSIQDVYKYFEETPNPKYFLDNVFVNSSNAATKRRGATGQPCLQLRLRRMGALLMPSKEIMEEPLSNIALTGLKKRLGRSLLTDCKIWSCLMESNALLKSIAIRAPNFLRFFTDSIAVIIFREISVILRFFKKPCCSFVIL
eukprot:TRINITY_DN6882_c0_g1_i2.p1 TRINITY_DN6882_c0_g1~~TRINITY_DN6882_c0_g1_i2.p1  ORF type:complete len:199 (-),score=0.38 TRINITY_DN6882_c0_g1_i2:329-925(-)